MAETQQQPPADGTSAESVTDLERLFAAAEHVLARVGFRAGQTCLDFGCGHGNYAIPLARLVGPAGEVLALDRDEAALHRLAERARRAGVENVRTLPASGEPALPLANGSVDGALLYDVLHDHYFSPKQRTAMVEEAARVVRPGGRLSVFPRHMTDRQIARDVVAPARRLGFEAADEHRGRLVHDDDVTEGRILTFRKAE